MSVQPSPARGDTGAPPARDHAPMDGRQKREAAAYIASLLAGLRQIADGAELEKLVSALDNAFYEAFTLTNAKQTIEATLEQSKVAETG